MKSTVDEIRERFDADVERFSNLETGQAAAIDSPLHMELLSEAAALATPNARRVLDIGCGAGNYTLKLLRRLPDLQVTLVDLSQPMLDRALLRIREISDARVEAIQGDIRDLDLGVEKFDIVMAAQCLHHLRNDEQWQDVFRRVYSSLRLGGSFWIADSVDHQIPAIQQMIERQWGDYLIALKDKTYRDHVLAYVEKEDTPRSLQWQLELMRNVGFSQVDILHKNNRFATFGGIK